MAQWLAALVWFPAPAEITELQFQGIQLPFLTRHQAHLVHIYTFRQNTLGHKINLQKKKKVAGHGSTRL